MTFILYITVMVNRNGLVTVLELINLFRNDV